MRRRYLLALSLLALLSAAAYVSLVSVIRSHETYSSVINISGRQRMLSQRIAFLSSRLSRAGDAEYDDVRLSLRDAASLMRVSHVALTEGSEAMRVPAQLSEAVRASYYGPPLDVDRQVREYLARVESLLSAPRERLTPENPDLREIQASGPVRLLRSLDAVVSQYESEARAKTLRLQRLETLVLLLTLTTLVLEALFIFRPMVRRVEADRLQLLSSRDQLTHIAYHDPLTGLPNRSLFLDRLQQALAHGRRQGTKVAVLHLDLDRFKEVNDTQGHAAGDALLQCVAQRVKAVLREPDTVARLGGDEFGVILPGLTRPGDAAELASRICAVVSDPFHHQGTSIRSSTSIGITMFPDDSDVPERLLANADIAMYRSKEGDRGRYHFFHAAMKTQVDERQAHEELLRVALAQGEFVPHYQPQVRIGDGRLVALEVLARWQSPGRGPVPVGEFLDTAEASGLIVPIGEAVLRQACAQVRAWLDRGLTPLRISVNLSPAQLRRSDLAETLCGVLEESGLETRYLDVEVPEGIFIGREQDQVYAVLEHLHQRGVGIALDHFGTGSVSLTHLRHWPVDRLKIDSSFVGGLERNPADAAVVELLIRLGSSLRLDVVAEGVETTEQSDFLRRHGCQLGQGYLFGRPSSGDRISAFLHPLS